jgi:hypothetical protein
VATSGKASKVIRFTHPQLGQDVKGRAGYYVPVEEHSLLHRGREVLYVLGCACIDNSCCSAPKSWGYVQVPGFLVRRHVCRDESGMPVSEVEPIEDGADRAVIRQSLLEKHPGTQIDMWDAHCLEGMPSRSASEADCSVLSGGRDRIEA